MKKDYSNLHLRLVLKYYWQVIRHFKLSFFTVVIFTIIFSALDIYIPLQYLKLWNVLSNNDFAFIESAKSIIIFILFLKIIGWAIRRVSGFSLAYFESGVMAGLREQAFSYMSNHSYSFFVNNFTGSLTQKINKYAKSFERLTDRMASDGLPLLVRGLGVFVAVYTLLPKYAYILGVFSIIFLFTALIYTRYKIKYDVIAALADTKTTGVLSDSISNHSSIQIFTGHSYEKERVSETIQEQKKATVFNWYLWEGLSSIQAVYSVAIEFIIFWVAIKDWSLSIIALPFIVLLQSYIIRLIDNLWSFAGIIRAFYDGFADAQEMALILDTPYEIIDNNQESIKDIKGEVIFDDVTYVYKNNNTKVLDNFSLTISPGQKIAIVGSSGAGKTTFVRLMMRLFDLTSGKILIDKIDISKITQQNLREHIAFVPQDPVLFHRTLIDNIRYGRRDATDEEVLMAAHLAHCDDFIDQLPQGYNTYVGERGVKLSGGERQRVAIARAILKNAPILILDEATSSLDSHSESLIQDALIKLIGGKTTIVIAHRLSTIRQMDRIIVLEKGKIIEDGTHEELLNKKSGLYKKLWDLQAGGFKNII
ncbi:MAG: ABC transporter ATP-binding protein [Candidatus Nomurabacteria bacterium GW2011_GWE1_32_28]|uniref:ABC transporter ATP-binding protein n=1 Tax=Candidatus Nomurabacteria bacterium GW2011_GWF1_31_48 TaxID=1618767 RepID=A0A0G0BI15_9BACT|nr:MAG: ABC transporter ATP-binding protein [Candidatus Nomurabacteria bacterium GW2011_GWF2_30_133]KKP28934.1 MAG: ABC transporter ATP-binding protein [Candidatus Nomurabacteria bacterium GW2011_GWE2_31_40]KKP30672.1 MAG: ABC transporter ATP-binding protein [Candidatus Nomurabacteria bacterium GW2011_GWF1_31_48]KKP35190.1 MAG: ABC transporter ATP-binding protein [Candidatus Nomurabacteria bacterium GW2011_GWE1_32_28]HAS80500.1 ABC transporter ATP-binding protein [Candidatus Nomurabacteria bact